MCVAHMLVRRRYNICPQSLMICIDNYRSYRPHTVYKSLSEMGQPFSCLPQLRQPRVRQIGPRDWRSEILLVFACIPFPEIGNTRMTVICKVSGGFTDAGAGISVGAWVLADVGVWALDSFLTTIPWWVVYGADQLAGGMALGGGSVSWSPSAAMYFP